MKRNWPLILAIALPVIVLCEMAGALTGSKWVTIGLLLAAVIALEARRQ